MVQNEKWSEEGEHVLKSSNWNIDWTESADILSRQFPIDLKLDLLDG